MAKSPSLKSLSVRAVNKRQIVLYRTTKFIRNSSSRYLVWLALLVSLFSLSFVHGAQASGWKEIEPGVLFYAAQAQGPNGKFAVWMYLPRNHTGKLPCIFVAPAGTRLYHGKKLSTEDRAEHLPYVRAGFAVVAYEIDGDMPGDKAINECTTSIKQFIKADGGIDNAKLAIDATLDSMPEIDRERLYTAGHSSAGTLALLVAENDPRIKACAAFAPCCDVRARIGKPTINALALLVPECKGFFDHYSPDAGVKNLHCPVFLFHAKDDHIISSFEVGYFADQLKKTNSRVTYVEVPQGDHYDAMIDAGISQAIEWLKTIRSAPASLQSGKKSN